MVWFWPKNQICYSFNQKEIIWNISNFFRPKNTYKILTSLIYFHDSVDKKKRGFKSSSQDFHILYCDYLVVAYFVVYLDCMKYYAGVSKRIGT